MRRNLVLFLFVSGCVSTPVTSDPILPPSPPPKTPEELVVPLSKALALALENRRLQNEITQLEEQLRKEKTRTLECYVGRSA